MTTFIPENAAVWFEIPVADQARAKAFYAAVLGNELKDEDGGPNPMSAFPAASEKAVSGHLYPGKPAAAGTGITIHLAAPAPLETAMERVAANGGTVVSPIVTIPAGRFVYCLDPDGNSFGLFN
ncbi:MAG: VOC family protein [Rhizobiaceae bacterium]|nr:MAG: VOC family protein [Rhizobiaceae bacterium]CAG1016250.1 lactoylglutathione lyase [Rhizobiaceae bacterium]